MKKIFTLTALLLAAVLGASAQVSITVGEDVSDGTAYYRTFSSDKALDFTGVEGIKAYVGKKDIYYDDDTWETVSRLVLTAVDKVPAGTGVLIKADAAKTYTVAEAAEAADAAAVDNDFVAVLTPTATAGLGDIATLQVIDILDIDWTTLDYIVVGQKAGFGTTVPEELPAGTAYLALTSDEAYNLKYASGIDLKFTDTAALNAANIAEAKALLKGEDEGLVVNITLTNAIVTFASESQAIVEDKTGGLLLSNLFPTLKTGDVLNGTLTLEIKDSYGTRLFVSAGDATEASFQSLETSQGTVEAATLNDDNILDYIYNYEWVYVKFTDAEAVVDDGGNVSLKFAELFGNAYPVFDLLYVLNEEDYPKQGEKVTVEGYLFDYSLFTTNTYFQPVKITKSGDATRVNALKAGQPSNQVYNLNGQRVDNPSKGLYIRNGRKVLVK